MTSTKRTMLSSKERDELLKTLKARFEKNMNRHRGLQWSAVQARLEASPEQLWSLQEMERTGGEPDVVGHDKKTGEFVFYDCSAESPSGRRSVCYDGEALRARKEHKPKTSAMETIRLFMKGETPMIAPVSGWRSGAPGGTVSSAMKAMVARKP